MPAGASFGGTTSDDVKDAVLSRNLAEPTSYSTSAYTRERYEELPVGVTTVVVRVAVIPYTLVLLVAEYEVGLHGD